MKWVAHGKSWNKKGILKMWEQSRKDLHIPVSDRKYHDFLIVNTTILNWRRGSAGSGESVKVIGYISVKPVKERVSVRGYRLRLFVSHTRRGYGSEALNLMMSYLTGIGITNVHAFVLIYNRGATHFFNHERWRYIETVRVYGDLHLIYSYGKS